ncbi:MAG: hypothetical protein M1825_002205 [Sarcosagium campestre]|nr:MAG: hypothetical protein M1825_002205 [Sarcosagium campestre]
MFSTLGLFSQVPCPYERNCALPGCLFLHGRDRARNRDVSAHSLNDEKPTPTGRQSIIDEGTRKRRKLATSEEDVLSTKSTSSVTPANNLVDSLQKKEKGNAGSLLGSKSALTTLHGAVSPPSLRSPGRGTSGSLGTSNGASSGNRESLAKQQAPNPETLNPRMIPTPPASHAVRLAILKKLHEQLERLNREHVAAPDSTSSAPNLSPQDLIKMALDEEEQTARKNGLVYSNVIKNRIMHYKKMDLKAWREMLVEAVKENARANAGAREKPPKEIKTGLSSPEELALLPRLQANLVNLHKFGYVTSIPTEKDVTDAREGVELAQGWEQCDRCRNRFQVFPGRREEDGALTTGGPCRYHSARPRHPDKDQRDLSKPVDRMFPCCNEPIGETSGCSTAETHVFKVTAVNRLASTLQFEQTPPNETARTDRAVCLDCEMGYTALGLELIRLTATAWPTGEVILDLLVRPMGEVLDLNTRFSGVTTQQMTDAPTFDGTMSTSSPSSTSPDSPLSIAASPAVARAALFALISDSTPLMGHALENDLNACRIIHPALVDSALLFPHRRGLPFRQSLKMLVSRHLDRDIQRVGAGHGIGHDSAEDARAAGDLVRYALGKEWAKMRREGWSVVDGVFMPPAPVERKAKKQAKLQVDGGDDDSDAGLEGGMAVDPKEGGE